MKSVEHELDRLRDAARRELFADVERAKLHARQLGTAWVRRHSVLLLTSGALAGAFATSGIPGQLKRARAGGASTNGKAEKDAHTEENEGAPKAGGVIGATLGSLARAWLTNTFLAGGQG
jgi:hypothetical protein